MDSRPASTPRANHHILVCDDAATVRAMMSALLGKHYFVHLTSTAEEALALAPAVAPDLVISDLLLPGMSGAELIQRLRAVPALEDVPMILLTAVGESDARATGLEAGADDYLVKPIRERELLARVASLLRLRRTLLALSSRSRELEEANAALRSAQDRLLRTERLAALGTLAASLAHDINNPLSLVASGASALLAITEDATRLAQPPDLDRFQTLLGELHAVASEVADGTARLQGIGRDLRLFGAGEHSPAETVRAEDAARSAISIASARASASRLTSIDVTVTGAPEVDAPAHLVTLALLSILDRAVLAAGPTGRVQVEIGPAGASTAIRIRDDGPPIPTALLPRVFEPFVLIPPAQHTAGLGLSVAAGIVQGLGGHIDVDAALLRGASFTVVLPAPARSR
jgi:C4-dicarboxylate-specific signal transduction histidine kinase